MPNDQTIAADPEITAISAVYMALKDLDPGAQGRVLNYVASKLGMPIENAKRERPKSGQGIEDPVVIHPLGAESESTEGNGQTDLDGISPAGKKWMTRNGLTGDQLSAIFSLGIDDIDLVAKNVPGKGKRERMRNVFLLKGIAAYLGTGVARFTHEQVKEASLHYDAFDATNFATNLKSLISEVSGDKSTGYTLTTRGLTNGTELVKSLVAAN
jgi:hypothetical protein